MITFGLSAPIKKVQTEKGMTVEAVMAAARPGVPGVLCYAVLVQSSAFCLNGCQACDDWEAPRDILKGTGIEVMEEA